MRDLVTNSEPPLAKAGKRWGGTVGAAAGIVTVFGAVFGAGYKLKASEAAVTAEGIAPFLLEQREANRKLDELRASVATLAAQQTAILQVIVQLKGGPTALNVQEHRK